MIAPAKNFHSTLPSPEKITILLVSPHPDDLSCLRGILQNEHWNLLRCMGARDLPRHLANTAPSIVVCERDLPDGDWKDVLRETDRVPHAPLVLVTSRHADESLWAEVLNLGGYDVLLKPFDRSEVTRVVGMAWRYWFGVRADSKNPASQLTPQFA